MKKISYTASENVVMFYFKILPRIENDSSNILYTFLSIDTKIVVYRNFLTVFYGSNADIDFDFWVSKEKKLNNRRIYKEKGIDINVGRNLCLKTDYNKFSCIGSDEVGTGDYLAPIIVTAAFVDKNQIEYLKTIGIYDTKIMRRKNIMILGEHFVKNIKHSSVILSNEELNKKRGSNLNRIKAQLHNQSILNLEQKIDFNFDKVVIDEFCSKGKYLEYLKDKKDVEKNICSIVKADNSIIAVQVAAIISKYKQFLYMDYLKNKFNIEFPFGSGKYTIDFAKKMVINEGTEFLEKYVKIKFANTKKIDI